MFERFCFYLGPAINCALFNCYLITESQCLLLALLIRLLIRLILSKWWKVYLLVIKLLEITQGKGVVLAETSKAIESVINTFKGLQANILVQEFIKKAKGKDICFFAIDGKVVGSIQREAPEGDFRANLHGLNVCTVAFSFFFINETFLPDNLIKQ